MEQPPQTLRVLLLPYRGGQALLPNSAIVEILPFATPLPVEGAAPWVLGTLLWRARTIPLVCLERLMGQEPGAPGSRARIVVLNALGSNPRLPNYGFLTADAPRPLNLERSAIVPDASHAPPVPGVLSRVRVNDQPAVIPDLDDIEGDLGRLRRP
ncbi:MAG: chemotaxis protein CheW [Pseudomonadota bacterium]|nr:chemotaxis protein CheW [Pseudomonadota bacterium]